MDEGVVFKLLGGDFGEVKGIDFGGCFVELFTEFLGNDVGVQGSSFTLTLLTSVFTGSGLALSAFCMFLSS